MADRAKTLEPRPADERPRPTWAGPDEDFWQLVERADDDVDTLDQAAAMRGLWTIARNGTRDLDPEARAVARMMLDWLDDGSVVRFEKWMGLASPGRGGSLAEAMRLRTRDALLRQLARSEKYAGLAATTAAQIMATTWKRFAAIQRSPRGDEEHVFSQIGGDPLAASTIRDILLRKTSA